MRNIAHSLSLIHYDSPCHEQNLIFNNEFCMEGNQPRFNIAKLFFIGVLYCTHEEERKKKEAIWALINPDKDLKIDIERVV